MKNFLYKNYWWAIPAALAVVAVLYLWAQNRKRVNPAENPEAESLDREVTLYNGISGHTAEIMYLQRWLNQHGAAPALATDGRFGQKTAEALYKQKSRYDIALKDL